MFIFSRIFINNYGNNMKTVTVKIANNGFLNVSRNFRYLRIPLFENIANSGRFQQTSVICDVKKSQIADDFRKISAICDIFLNCHNSAISSPILTIFFLNHIYFSQGIVLIGFGCCSMLTLVTILI